MTDTPDNQDAGVVLSTKCPDCGQRLKFRHHGTEQTEAEARAMVREMHRPICDG